ncbi:MULTISPECIES: hypothetical protein [Shewanella]|uniref:hypothetical protein n=1 Tax=Shewanella TaxID=22 RepID=UPI00048E9E2C|nr:MULTISPECIES: hypothetical protein [Shewanella]QLE83912.1 hypothetical protein FLM48_01690 [Shewanella sp. Scap07]
MKARTKLSASIKSATLLATMAVIVAGTAVGVQQLNNDESASACVCDASSTYNSALPASHPNNRCADQSHNVSWKNWFTGKSRSGQFHFVDLLELLHGHQDSPMDDVPANSNQTRR